MNITIIGTGVYGIAMAIALSQNKENKMSLGRIKSTELLKKRQ